MNSSQPPYPADTRAKGWRFELDYEQIEQSDTWDLAGSDGRPWLLMMWLVSWRQAPCGSMPTDEAVVAAKIGASPAVWKKHRASLMRGWVAADDGRMYHQTITARVLEMLDYRNKNAARVAKFKAAKREERIVNALPPQQQQGSNDTGTGTGSKELTENLDGVAGEPAHTGGFEPEFVTQGQQPTLYGAITRSLRQAGISQANPAHIRFRALVDAGASADEFLQYVPKALGISGDRFAYIVGAAEGERKRAAANAGLIHQGAFPAQKTAYLAQREAQAAAWIGDAILPGMRGNKSFIDAEDITHGTALEIRQ